jgi:GNAT superfamily N-acetyltransferase
VLDLLESSLGGGPAGRRPPEFFRWKHLANPFGRSYAILAEHEGRVVGFRTFMRWRFVLDDRPVTAVRAVDTATHPDMQGQGIFTRLTRAALEDLRSDTDLVFNTPNDKSLPGYLKMGWRRVGEVPIRVRVRHPVAFARGVRHLDAGPLSSHGPRVKAPPAAEVLSGLADDALARLLPAPSPGRLSTDRSAGYLRWRYADAPVLGYRAVSVRDGSMTTGIAIFRVRPRGPLWETTISEVLVSPGDVATARHVLRAAVRSAEVDHVTCSLPSGSTGSAAARRVGFLPSPEGLTLVANLLREVPVDPLALDSWSLTLGDLEVF